MGSSNSTMGNGSSSSTMLQNTSNPDNSSTDVINTTASTILDFINDDSSESASTTTMAPIVVESGLLGANSSYPISGPTTTNETTSETDNDFNFKLFGWDLYPYQWFTLSTMYTLLDPLSSIAMVVGCILPYVPQYMSIYKSRNSSGFSIFVCLNLLLANIARVAFWFGHPFEPTLLIQSGIMILTQVLLLKLCVDVRRETEGLSQKKASLFSSGPRNFWAWTDLASYIEFLIIFTTSLSAAMYLLKENKPFVETVGFCSLLTESVLALPQVIKNHRNRSVAGMSVMMVLMWFVGDSFKSAWYIVKKQPYQFLMCGIVQCTIDVIILLQVCVFRQNSPLKSSKGQELAQI